MRRVLPLLLLLVTTQAPAVPGETTLVSFCKQGRLAACEELKKLFPEKYAEFQAELAKAALRQEALKAAEEVAHDDADAKDAEAAGVEASAEASGEPPNCDGQNHHVISRPIAQALEEHRTLHGLYEPRDERFVAKAKDKDKESHCGYQKWHRKVDEEVVSWLERNRSATAVQFMKKLREIYSRKDMLKRFPNGFGPAN
jgi:hypothetical protein